MSVLARVNWVSQQRIDIQHLTGEQSFNAADFRFFGQMLSGLDANYVVKGFEITSTNGLRVTVNGANGAAIVPLNNTTSFIVTPSDEPLTELELSSNATYYVEAYFTIETDNAVLTGQWDPGEGDEYTSETDFQKYVQIHFRARTEGFTPDALPLHTVETGNIAVTKVTDHRNMFYSLRSGGTVPDPLNRFSWATERQEPSSKGDPARLGQNHPDNPYYQETTDGYTNDRAINSLKDWMNAVMTRIIEIDGNGGYWYDSESFGSGISLTGLFEDSKYGSSRNDVDDVLIEWSYPGDEDTLKLTCTDTLRWGYNYGGANLVWHFGKTFTSSTDRSYSVLDYQSPVLTENQAIYLMLERHVYKNDGLPVLWENIDGNTGAVVADRDDLFTGIAVGDYIKKASEGYDKYYRIIEIRYNESSTYSSVEGIVSPDEIRYLVIDTAHEAPGGVEDANEPLHYFRSRYDENDLVISDEAHFNRNWFLWGKKVAEHFISVWGVYSFKGLYTHNHTHQYGQHYQPVDEVDTTMSIPERMILVYITNTVPIELTLDPIKIGQRHKFYRKGKGGVTVKGNIDGIDDFVIPHYRDTLEVEYIGSNEWVTI